MGRCAKDYLLNRIKKIARHKIRRKNKSRNSSIIITSKQDLLNINKDRIHAILENDKFYKSSIFSKDRIELKVPISFCFIDSPDETLCFLKEVNYVFDKTSRVSIYLDFSGCANLGLDASVILDRIVINGMLFRKKRGINTKLEGNVPIDLVARELFFASGLLKHLNLSNYQHPKIKRLEPFQKDKDVSSMTTKTLAYYNSCLQKNGFELNESGLDYFGELIGEVIDNANRHKGPKGDWMVSGHYNDGNAEETGKGRLTFMSFGNTIYESLKCDSVVSSVKEELAMQTLKQKDFFDINYNEEAAWTVFALQYGISCKAGADILDGGRGTIKIIDAFSKVGKTFNNIIPKMIIQSGFINILFDGTYYLKSKNISGKNVKIIAFNDDNDLSSKPNAKYVKTTKHKFPGVIISLDFYVDQKFLKKLKEGENEGY